MSHTSHPKVPTSFVLLAALLCASAAVAAQPASEPRCPDNDPHVVRVDVTIDLAKKSISVLPESITLHIGQDGKNPRRACWAIAGLREGDELSFENKAAGQPDLLPQMRRTARAQNPYVNSGNPSKAGVWRYQVTVRDSSGATVASVDPEVIIGY
jgi:hypothetical protein